MIAVAVAVAVAVATIEEAHTSHMIGQTLRTNAAIASPASSSALRSPSTDVVTGAVVMSGVVATADAVVAVVAGVAVATEGVATGDVLVVLETEMVVIVFELQFDFGRSCPCPHSGCSATPWHTPGTYWVAVVKVEVPVLQEPSSVLAAGLYSVYLSSVQPRTTTVVVVVVSVFVVVVVVSVSVVVVSW